MELNWTAFFVTVSFLGLFIVAWAASKAGPGKDE